MSRLLKNISILKHSVNYFENSKRCFLGLSAQICSFSTKGKKRSKSDGSDSADNMGSPDHRGEAHAKEEVEAIVDATHSKRESDRDAA